LLRVGAQPQGTQPENFKLTNLDAPQTRAAFLVHQTPSTLRLSESREGLRVIMITMFWAGQCQQGIQGYGHTLPVAMLETPAIRAWILALLLQAARQDMNPHSSLYSSFSSVVLLGGRNSGRPRARAADHMQGSRLSLDPLRCTRRIRVSPEDAAAGLGRSLSCFAGRILVPVQVSVHDRPGGAPAVPLRVWYATTSTPEVTV
jgi:hypothetical protein